MISKTIHYCWFGKGQKNTLINYCINTWKEKCPDYKIVEWNEENFDIHSNKYVEEAYNAKKWAFVTDYVRLYALYHEGGVYLDTDVELIKPIDEFLDNNAFSGFETDEYIPTAIMGAEKGNEWIKYLLSYYDNRHFVNDKGEFDMTTNVITISKMTTEKYDLKLNGELQEVKDIFKIYPKDYFCPKDYATGEINLTNNTACIHHFNASWLNKIDVALHNKKMEFIKKFGKEIGEKKYIKWYKKRSVFIHIKRDGLKKTIDMVEEKVNTLLCNNKTKGEKNE